MKEESRKEKRFSFKGSIRILTDEELKELKDKSYGNK